MPNDQPKTDPGKALSELLADALKQRRDLEWPENTLATARKEFADTLGNFLKTVGAERPDVDFWGGQEAAGLRAYMVKTVVPAIVERAVATEPNSRVMTPQAFTRAMRSVMDDKKIVSDVHDLIRKLSSTIGEVITVPICLRGRGGEPNSRPA